MKFKRVVPIVMSLAMLGGTVGMFAGCNNDNNEPEVPPEGGDAVDTSVALAADKKIYVVGDSTVCDYAKSGEHEDVKKNAYYVVRYGYGTQLHEYLNVQKSQVVNLALSGRSSLSFTGEANYTTLTSGIGQGDYLIIGFGHNDQKEDKDGVIYYTNPNLTTDDETTANGASFKYTLYQNYVKMALDKGATPILCTPIVRYDTNGNYNAASGHITATKEVGGKTYLGGDYPKAIRELAAEKSVALVDLTEMTKTLYSADNADAAKYHAYYSYKMDGTNKVPDNMDKTHINEWGAKMVAYKFAQALKGTECGLKAQVKTDKSAPTESDFTDKVNASFTLASSKPFDPETDAASWPNIKETGWYGTAFGDIGGSTKVSNFKLSAENGTYTAESTGNGKIQGSSDGLGAIFKQIDATKDFTAEVTATVNKYTLHSQASFGLMLRDDIYINQDIKGVNSNYVSAGILGSGAVFARSGGSLISAKGSASAAAGSVYTLKIQKAGNIITATVTPDGGTAITQTYDSVSLTANDVANIYLCLYIARDVKVTFTNFTIQMAA